MDLSKPLRIFTQNNRPEPLFFASTDYVLDGDTVVSVENQMDVSEDVNRYIRTAASVCYMGNIQTTSPLVLFMIGAEAEVYVFCTWDQGPGFQHFCIMDNRGEIHGQHMCSDISFAMGDLYLNRPDIQESLKAKFSAGYKVWLLPMGCIPPASVIEKSEAQYPS